MFEVSIGKKPRKFLEEETEEKPRQKILALFDSLALNPWPAKEYDLTKLEGLEDCFRIRIGRYRVCYHINTEIKEVTVYRIERRSETTYR